MRSRRLSMLWVAAALAVALTAPAYAQDKDPGMDGTVTGKVVAVDGPAGTMTIETPTSTVTYRTDSGSRFMHEGKTVMLTSMKAGDRVTVYFKGAGDNPVVTRAEVLSRESETAQNLPATGSSLPLVGLLGVVLIVAAGAIRVGLRSLH